MSDPWEPVRCVTVFVAHGACRRGLERHCSDKTDLKTVNDTLAHTLYHMIMSIKNACDIKRP